MNIEHMDYVRKYPRLIPLLQWLAILSRSEALSAIRVYKQGQEAGCAGDAVAHYCGGKGIQTLIHDAYSKRGAWRKVALERNIQYMDGCSILPLTKAQIDKCFEEAEHQVDYCLALFQIAIPADWQFIAQTKGYPKIGKKTATYIMEKAIEFDRKHHPNVMNGGRWMSMGFSQLSDVKLDEWAIYLDELEIVWVEL